MVGNSPFVSSWFLFPGPCWGQGLELDNERSGVMCSWLALSPLLLRDHTGGTLLVHIILIAIRPLLRRRKI